MLSNDTALGGWTKGCLCCPLESVGLHTSLVGVELSEKCHRLCIAKRELLIEVVAFEVQELSQGFMYVLRVDDATTLRILFKGYGINGGCIV